jgi:hypothetical protein
MSFKGEKTELGDGRMKTIETTAMVTQEGTMTVQVPLGISPGEHQIVVVIDEHPIVKKERPSLKFSAYPVGLVSEQMTFRREDIYGEWGR